MATIIINQWLQYAIIMSVMRVFASSSIGTGAVKSVPQVSAIFVFGDSLVDHGNNNYLSTFAKSNYMPYGIDFYQGPTGRFSNGRTAIDFLGEHLGLPYLPAYENAKTIEDIAGGVNYASAGGGILEETGQYLGERFNLGQQVNNFKSTLKQLKNHTIGGRRNISQYLAKSLAVMVVGSNDYINNYLLPSLYTTSYLYKPEDYAVLLIDRYTNHILELYNAGLRKFYLSGVGPLGCIPNQLATGVTPPGRCVSYVNEMVGFFNVRLRSLVDRLNANLTGSIFAYGNTYGTFEDVLNNSPTYGFKVTDRACCGVGWNEGQITCLPLQFPCMNRNQYVFWDAFHPTEAVNAIIAKKAYAGLSSDCHPINVQRMAQI